MNDSIKKIKELLKIESAEPHKAGKTTFWVLPGHLKTDFHRDYGPAIESPDGTNSYYKHGIKHRDNGPAIENLLNGYQAYYVNGKLHREDGPAIIQNKTCFYYINGLPLTETEFFQKYPKNK